jgi:hypothetical protein
MTEVSTLLTQIARTKRFAAAMTNDADRERFSSAAAELEDKLLRCQSIRPKGISSDTDTDL